MFRNPPPTISGIGPQPIPKFKEPIQGLQDAFTDPYNLSHEGAEQAGEFYRNASDLNGPNNPSVLDQAVHMGQRAQAQDYSDTQGLKGFNQALKEREATIPIKQGGLDLPNSPINAPNTFDPSFQTSAVNPAIQALKRFR